MTLIICKECKTGFSDSANYCPNCGATWSAARGKQEPMGCFTIMFRGYLGGFFILGGLVTFVLSFAFDYYSEIYVPFICLVMGIFLIKPIFRKPKDRQ